MVLANQSSECVRPWSLPTPEARILMCLSCISLFGTWNSHLSYWFVHIRMGCTESRSLGCHWPRTYTTKSSFFMKKRCLSKRVSFKKGYRIRWCWNDPQLSSHPSLRSWLFHNSRRIRFSFCVFLTGACWVWVPPFCACDVWETGVRERGYGVSLCIYCSWLSCVCTSFAQISQMSFQKLQAFPFLVLWEED